MRALALALAMLLSSVAHANPIDALGFGSRAISMGGAGSAISDDGAANHYNPAGLVRQSDLRIDLGYRWARPILRMNGRDVGVDDVRGWQVGLVAPGRIGPFRFAFGVALWLPDQRLSRTRSLPFDQPRFVYYDNRMQRLLLAANLAIQIVPGLYVGAGLAYMSRTQGSLGLEGSIAVSDPDASSLVTRIDVDLISVRYPQAGILWEATRNLAFALTYRHSFQLQVDQAFRIEGNVGDPGLPPIVENGFFAARVRSVDLFQPWQITAGFSARLLRRFLVTFDATYARWHDFPTPASQLDLDLNVGVFQDRVRLPPPREYPASRFRDTITPRVGLEVRARDNDRLAVDLRGGYNYEPTPVPDQFGESNLVDCDKHTFSLGAGLELGRLAPVLPRPLSIDAHLAVTWLPERVTQKASPVDRVGDFRADGVVVQLGFMLRSRF